MNEWMMLIEWWIDWFGATYVVTNVKKCSWIRLVKKLYLSKEEVGES